jgi:hypothetical protein
MTAKVAAIGLYGLVGSVFQSAGATVLLLGTGLLPAVVRKLRQVPSSCNPS